MIAWRHSHIIRPKGWSPPRKDEFAWWGHSTDLVAPMYNRGSTSPIEDKLEGIKGIWPIPPLSPGQNEGMTGPKGSRSPLVASVRKRDGVKVLETKSLGTQSPRVRHGWSQWSMVLGDRYPLDPHSVSWVHGPLKGHEWASELSL